jgi:hypothetical protein
VTVFRQCDTGWECGSFGVVERHVRDARGTDERRRRSQLVGEHLALVVADDDGEIHSGIGESPCQFVQRDLTRVMPPAAFRFDRRGCEPLDLGRTLGEQPRKLERSAAVPQSRRCSIGIRSDRPLLRCGRQQGSV